MQPMNIYDATVPVFLRYLEQLLKLYDILEEQGADPNVRLVQGGFSGGEHFSVAQGFCLRTICPILGRAIPELSNEGTKFTDLREGNQFVKKYLLQLEPVDFETAETKTVQHSAGQADLSQPVQEYALHFGLPNFFFHLVSGYSAFRTHGFQIGKADFDGLHAYEKGFKFS